MIRHLKHLCAAILNFYYVTSNVDLHRYYIFLFRYDVLQLALIKHIHTNQAHTYKVRSYSGIQKWTRSELQRLLQDITASILVPHLRGAQVFRPRITETHFLSEKIRNLDLRWLH